MRSQLLCRAVRVSVASSSRARCAVVCTALEFVGCRSGEARERIESVTVCVSRGESRFSRYSRARFDASRACYTANTLRFNSSVLANAP